MWQRRIRIFMIVWFLGGLGLGTGQAEDRALFIGINDYQSLQPKLKGAVNDAHKMQQFAQRVWGYRPDQTRLLLNRAATRAGILDAIRTWLIEGTTAGDRVLLYYSGHGFYTRDTNGDEDDGLDETLVSADTYQDALGTIHNMVLDDEVQTLLDRIDDRQVTVIYVLRTGCAWRFVPNDLPPWGIVSHYFWRWRRDGTWKRINDILRGDLRVLEGRTRQPSAAIIDSQTVKTTDRGGDTGFDGAKQLKGRKRHILVDTLGLLIAVVVTAANVQDRDGAKILLAILRHWFTRLRCIWADGAYAGALEPWVALLRSYRKVRLEIVKRSDHAKGFIVLPKRWIVERTFGWLYKYRRLSKDYEYLTDTSEAMIYVAMIHIMVRRIACMTPF